jgi:hypothetical protein
MSKVLSKVTAMLAVMTASLVFVTSALAQMPTSPWKKGAPFPEPDEELYGFAANGKLYVFGGLDEGKARGVAYEYNPATDKWTKKTSMPRPAHHAALAAANGKIYVMGGFVPPKDTAIPLAARGNPSTTRGSTIRRLTRGSRCRRCRQARVRGRRGSRRQDLRDRRRHDGGRVQGPVLHVLRTCSRPRHQRRVRPATNKWQSREPMSVPRNHAFSGVVNGKIYVIGGRTGHAFILSATNTDVVEEYNPVSNTWSCRRSGCHRSQRRGLGHGRPPDLRGRG